MSNDSDPRRKFLDDGFVIKRGLFSWSEVRKMLDGFEALWEIAERLPPEPQMHEGSKFVLSARGTATQIQRVVWCGGAAPSLDEFGRDPRLVGLAGEIMGTTIVEQLINQAHFKLPGDGVEFPWHQDIIHRVHDPGDFEDLNGTGSYVQTIIALDPMDQHNGALEIIPRSHLLGALHLPAGELPADLRDSDGRVLELNPGDAVAFGPYLFHRSLPNRYHRARRVFINGYALPGANARTYPGRDAGRSITTGEHPIPGV